jgi:hypothetical protein
MTLSKDPLRTILSTEVALNVARRNRPSSAASDVIGSDFGRGTGSIGESGRSTWEPRRFNAGATNSGSEREVRKDRQVR